MAQSYPEYLVISEITRCDFHSDLPIQEILKRLVTEIGNAADGHHMGYKADPKRALNDWADKAYDALQCIDPEWDIKHRYHRFFIGSDGCVNIVRSYQYACDNHDKLGKDFFNGESPTGYYTPTFREPNDPIFHTNGIRNKFVDAYGWVWLV